VGGKEVSKTICLRYSETASMHGTSCQHMMRTPKLQKRKRKTVAEHEPMHEDPSVFSSLGIGYNGSSITTRWNSSHVSKLQLHHMQRF
jgi:hypothetical protein